MKPINRRTFLNYSLNASISFSLLSSPIWTPCQALAKDIKEDQKKEKLAKYTFNFSSPYFTENFKTTPHAHNEIKNLIEKHTKNKVYVKIHDGGSKGIGSSLSNSVRFGLSQGALLSMSNLSPMVNEVDILNVPFWSASAKEYVRLINSKAWEKYVLSKTKKYNFKVLFSYVVGARTASSLKKYGKTIKSPEDFVGVRFRIPGSKSLAVFYKLTKARPSKNSWGRCARAARAGRFEALDPSIIGLYAGPDGLNKEIGIISEIESVHDGWVALGNNDFIESLDTKTRVQFFDAIEEIKLEQVKLYQNSREFCIQKFNKLGTTIYTLTKQEKDILAKTFGHTNPAWNPVKKSLLGDNGMAIFDELFKVAKG